MATYNLTVTTTAADEKGLDFVLAKINTARAAEDPPKAAITKAQYLNALVDNLIVDYKRQYKADLRDRVGTALDAAPNAQVTEVAGILGVTE